MLEDPSYDFFAGTFDFDTPTVWLLAAVTASSLLWAGLLGLRFVHLAAWWAGGLAAGLLISIPFVLILPESKLRTLVVLTSLFLIAMTMATGRIKRSQQTRLEAVAALALFRHEVADHRKGITEDEEINNALDEWSGEGQD